MVRSLYHYFRLMSFDCNRFTITKLGQIITKYRPAVIGLQEVTLGILAILRKQNWYQYYDSSFDSAMPCNSSTYFVLLLTVLPIVKIATVSFRGPEFSAGLSTRMDRELVVATLRLNATQSIVVGTTHLESLPQSSPTRLKQLQVCFDTLSLELEQDPWCIGAMLMGDTNLMAGEIFKLDKRSAQLYAFRLSKAVSNRAKCAKCKNNIQKDSVRVGQKEGNIEALIAKQSPMYAYFTERWFHTQCFFQNQQSLLREISEQNFRGFSSLALAEQQHLSAELATLTSTPRGRQVKVQRQERLGMPTGWSDVWLTGAGNTHDNGPTYDSETNKFISLTSSSKKKEVYQSRYDRMFFKQKPQESDEDDIVPLIEINRVGMEPIDIENLIWPSDHYGLHCCLDLNIDVDVSSQEQHEARDRRPKKKQKSNHHEVIIIDSDDD